jgi:hypothetical protein
MQAIIFLGLLTYVLCNQFGGVVAPTTPSDPNPKAAPFFKCVGMAIGTNYAAMQKTLETKLVYIANNNHDIAECVETHLGLTGFVYVAPPPPAPPPQLKTKYTECITKMTTIFPGPENEATRRAGCSAVANL